jgi:hypothetical protein
MFLADRLAAFVTELKFSDIPDGLVSDICLHAAVCSRRPTID